MEMNDLLSYNDHCVITRSTNEVDEYGTLVEAKEIYNDVCDFQPGGQQAGSIMTYTDKVYIQGVIPARSNDSIDITPQYGIGRKGVIEYVNFLGLEITDDCVTEISIKQSTEKL